MQRPTIIFFAGLCLICLACGGPSVRTVRIVLASGQCTPQVITLRLGEPVRISFLNQDAGGASWQLFFSVPTKERPTLPPHEPSLQLFARAQQAVSAQVTPRQAGQFEYTCITESRSVRASTGRVNVVE